MKTYRPSNGTEGEIFYGHWCAHCERDAEARKGADADPALMCSILADTFAYDVTDARYPKEWIEDERGPRCTAFTTDPTCPARCGKTIDMFPAAPKQPRAT